MDKKAIELIESEGFKKANWFPFERDIYAFETDLICYDVGGDNCSLSILIYEEGGKFYLSDAGLMLTDSYHLEEQENMNTFLRAVKTVHNVDMKAREQTLYREIDIKNLKKELSQFIKDILKIRDYSLDLLEGLNEQ